ncbi:MAG TPA: acetylornithine/succinylornithine family transaminase [Longimicrobiales bacterium]
MSVATEVLGSQAGVAASPAASPLLGVYRQAGPVFVAGRGSRLIAEDGREYLDFTSGIGVNALGYGETEVTRAIREALTAGVLHTSNLFRTRPAEALAAELVRLSFADRVFFCNSGAEANEGAFKFARRWARTQGGPQKHEIVALRGSFHGRLFGSLAATDRPKYQEPFEPLMPGVRFIPVGDEAAARAAISPERTAAVIVEPIQGEGEVRPVDEGFLRTLRALADEANAALIFDEVQCGLGRTGSLFAYQELGVVPDILTLAKPLAGGLPMGAVLLSERIASAVQPGDHATTFGGGLLVSTVALAVVRRIADPAFLAGVREKGKRVRAALEPLTASPRVREVRGRGLMWGIELEEEAAPVVAQALERGLLVLVAGERVVRLLPPLTIPEEDLDAGLSILVELLS